MTSEMTLEEKRRLAVSVLEAYGRQDLEAVLEALHPAVEWVPPIALAEGRVFRGHAGVRRWWADLTSTFEGFSAEVDEVREVGGRLVVLGRLRSRGKESGVEISDEVGWLWGFREGTISSMHVYLSHGEALKAVSEG